MRKAGGPSNPVYITGSEIEGELTPGSAIPTSTVPVAVDNDFTGIINVPVAGTEMQGGNIPSAGEGFALRGHPDNTDDVWVMPHGRTKANGFPLSYSHAVIVNVSNLNALDFDADVNNNKICWIKL